MIDEIVELKKIYYKLLNNISEYEKYDDMGVLPDECTPFWNKDVKLAKKLNDLIIEFNGDQ